MPSWFGIRRPEKKEWVKKKMVSWMSGASALLVWKKGTWASKVGNREYGVLDGRIFDRLVWKKGTWSARVGNRECGVVDGKIVLLLILKEGYMGNKSWK